MSTEAQSSSRTVEKRVADLLAGLTLEEKVSAIIQRKRRLMNSIVKEDDPGLLKTFTREELIDMLGLPPVWSPKAP